MTAYDQNQKYQKQINDESELFSQQNKKNELLDQKNKQKNIKSKYQYFNYYQTGLDNLLYHMRSILKYGPLRQFSTNKLSQVIQHTNENLKQQQSNNYLKYEDVFFNLYTAHLSKQKKLNLNVRKLDAICMLGDFPCKSIVEQFHATAKSYSEEYTVQTFVRLSRAYKISQADNASTADYSINRLFFTPAFENLIEQYKYGLRKQHAITWDNAFLVAQCLIDIGYVDYEVFSILMNMVESKLNKQQRNDTQIRKFQIEKKDYYIGRHQNTQQNLSNDPQFLAVLKMLSQKVRQHEMQAKKEQSLKELQKQLTQNQESQTVYHSIMESISLIESYNQNLTKLIEGIITIRKQYRKMTELSESKDILRNPELNLELLDLEEMLLLKKLITIADIKNPERIDSEELELRRVEEILIQMIEPERLQLSASDLTEYLNANFNEVDNKQAQRLTKYREISEYGRAMATLTRYAEVSRRLYCAPDSRSLISMKWQKTLLLWNQGGSETTQWKENLHPQKIFRRTFADLYKMMKRSYSIFMFTFIQAPLKYKLEFFESLTRLGYHTELIHLLENEDFGKEKIETYSNQEFFSLIKILNQIGQKISADQLKRAALKHLKKLYDQSEFEESKSIFSMQFCTNAVNFICQNFNVQSVDLVNALSSKDQTQVLYENLINKLGQQAKYFDESVNFLTNDHLYEALRVLSMEKPGEFKLSTSWFARFNIDVSDKKKMKEFLYRKNPFHTVVEQLCDQYTTPAIKDHHPFIQTGFNQKGELTAVLLCSSDQSSIDGKYVNGNTAAYISRVKREFNISINPLTVNSFLEIDYDKISQNKEFAFKPKEEIARILNQLFKRDELHLMEFSQTLANIAFVLEKHYKRSYMYAIVKLLNTLNECVRLYDNEKEILTFQLFRFRRFRLMVQLDSLKEDYNLIDKSVKEELEKMWKKEISLTGSEFLRKQSSILGVVEAIQQAILNSVDTKGQDKTLLTKTLFEGKRFTIETFIQNDLQKQNIGIEFINPTTYVNKTFCPYSDWADALKRVYPLDTVNINQSSNVVKILAKKFLPNVGEQLTLLPYAKKSTLKDKPEFTLNSLDPIPNPSQENEKLINVSEQHLEEIRELLSFVHELKISKSEEQLIEYIFSFDFINNVNQKTHEKSNIQPLPRQHNSYFNYLEGANNKLYLESPNLEYLFNKLEQRQDIQQVFAQRKKLRAEAKIEFQLGNISRKDFIRKCERIDDQIISKLQTLDKNILDNVEEYKFFQSGLKMVKIQKDEREIERVLNRARYYYRNLDKDFVHVKGNVDRCLKIKRAKAERTLSLYKVLYKVAKGQIQLTEAEKQVLRKQASLITYRLENKKEHLDAFSEKFTTLTVGDLSKADKQKLQLGGSDLSAFTSLPLTDLILEFVNLLDPKVHENFEKLIVKRFYTSSHGLPEQIFSSGLNKEFTKLAHEEERQIINNHSRMDFYDMGILNEMAQTFKTESKSGKERYAYIYDSFYEEIEQLNDSEARVELISEYLTQKEHEYDEDYNPKLITEIKQAEVMKLWSVLFKKSYQESGSELIRQTVSKLCERIRIMGDAVPPFFGLLVIKILQHPQTDFLSKENLISTLSQFKTRLNIDSEDIRLLGEACAKEEKQTRPNSKRLIEQMGLISNKNFMEKMNKKINMIV